MVLAGMRSIAPTLALVALGGCTAHQAAPWVPELVVRGRVVLDEGASPRGEARGLDWRLEGAVRWQLSRAPASREPAPSDRPRARPASRCAHPVTCEWEARERARALSSGLELARVRWRPR